jgi:hypothetical protein
MSTLRATQGRSAFLPLKGQDRAGLKTSLIGPKKVLCIDWPGTGSSQPANPEESQMKKPKDDPKPRTIALNPNPKGEFKIVGGSLADDWNMRLLNNVHGAVPINHSDAEASNKTITPICEAMADMAPDDPIEGILIAQLMAANEASLAMYKKGWAQPPEYIAARTKYLQLADNAARRVVVLTERLDHHRGRGQQQITVKCDHEQRHGRSSDYCRWARHRRRCSQSASWCAPVR